MDFRHANKNLRANNPAAAGVSQVYGDQAGYASGLPVSAASARPSNESSSRLRTLLVPLDGSTLAEHALPHALAIARRSGATIRLVHVYSPSAPPFDSLAYSREFLKHFDEQQVRKMRDYLVDVARRISLRDSVRVITFVSRSKRIAEQLHLAAHDVDLVVMATHARGRFRRLWTGSMADELIRKVSCPLLLVRGYRSPVDLTGDPIARKILVPLDGSISAESILPPVATIGEVSGAPVTLLHVDGDGEVNPYLSAGEALDYLTRRAASMNPQPKEVLSQLVMTDEHVAKTVRSFASQHEFDLVALTSRARSGLSRFARGSIADAVIRNPGIALLVLCPKAELTEVFQFW